MRDAGRRAGMSQEKKPEDVAVPDIDIVGETVEEFGEVGARVLPHPKRPPPPGEEPRHPEREAEEDYHVGGVRGPQEPGPWGSDEAIRNQPVWGAGEDNPMHEGSE
jgi:hypothetical protein